MQDLFVTAYLVDLNATKAARTAGYKHPGTQGPRLLGIVAVQEAIANGRTEQAARFTIKADDVLVELGKLAMVNMLDYSRVDDDDNLVHDFSELTRDQAACINAIENKTVVRGEDRKETEVKFKLHDKRQALVDLGRHFGLFLDRTESVVKHVVHDTPEPTPEEWAAAHNVEDLRTEVEEDT